MPGTVFILQTPNLELISLQSADLTQSTNLPFFINDLQKKLLHKRPCKINTPNVFIHVIFDDGIFIIIVLCLNFNS